MKASVYLNYTSRSLFRGGQRTVLALFCIAVGVMSIVALQLVGQMINNSYTSNVRVANGGDIAISSYTSGLSDSDLTYFDTLKTQGKISNYTATASVYGALGSAFSSRNQFMIQIVDPQKFPLVGDLTFNTPAGGQLANLLQHHQVVMDQQLADQYNKKVGDTLDISVLAHGQIKTPIKLAGIVADSGLLQSRSSLMFMSIQDYKALVNPKSWLYSNVYVTTPVADDAHIKAASSLISDKFPLMSITTTTDALKQRQDQIDIIKKFLEVAGLLALLIGGVGIVNTMQVLLSRRKVEIAMLKTAGYRRLDLYLLFGLEAGLLGLIGGVIGALAACGMSFVVAQVMQNAMGITIPFQLDPWIISGGVLIGLCTALIFGLMPIVQAANIRPLNVLRDTQSGNVLSNVGLSIVLVLLLSILFCVMAGVILNSAMLAIYAVYGAFLVLLILALVFLLIVFLIGHLPVPEHFSLKHILLVGLPLLLSLALTLLLPTFGLILTGIALMGIVVVFLPRGWKSNIKMALRNIGRSRGRTVTTMLALYVGVFTIGLILTLAQNLRAEINNTLAKSLSFNIAAVTAEKQDTQAMNTQSASIPGLQHIQHHSYLPVVPVSIDGQSIADLFRASHQKQGGAGASYDPIIASVYLGSLEGYDVANQQVPDTSSLTIVQGRNLRPADAGTDNVILNTSLQQVTAFKGHLKVGSTIILTTYKGQPQRTVHVVGFYRSFVGGTAGEIFSPNETVTAFIPAQSTVPQVYYIKVDPNQVGKALNKIGTLAPSATVQNLADIGSYIDQFVNNALLMLTVIASLSLLAGIIIIANAVALAMLERRRELGILKAVGYTSQSLLGEVLVENGVIGGTGALLAMLLVTLVTSLIGKYVFQTSFGVSWYIAVGLIIGIAVLAIVTALSVAWNAVRVRPLEVLRYE